MDVNTLEVYVLDNIEDSIIQFFKKTSSNRTIKPLSKLFGESVVKNKIDELLNNNILFDKRIAIENIEDINTADNDWKTINYIDVLISENCNLACVYCFVKNGQYHGKKSLMRPEVGKKTIDFLIRQSGSKKDLFICFFGGEPLMNYSVIEDMVVYALEEGRKSDKSFHFSITTNGTLLTDEMIRFIRDYQISVQISVDGDAVSQNINRPFSGGGGSYLKLVENLKKLTLQNITCSARVTVTSHTKKFIAKNYEHLSSLGFKKIHFENALALQGNMFIKSEKDIEDIKKQYSLITKNIIHSIQSDESFNIESFPLPLAKIVFKRIKKYSCNAGKGYVSVDINGNIYICHRLVGLDRFYMGNILDDSFDGEWTETITKEMRVEKKRKCSKCWARHICGGGCYEVNYNFNNDISSPPDIYCRLMKYSIKEALLVYAEALT